MAMKPAKESKERKEEFYTNSWIRVKRLYTPEDLKGFNPRQRLSEPGAYPFTRGVHENMYRGRLWTMRMFSGFGTPQETNKRYKFLLKEGETGLSVAFDLPTLYGYDSDHALATGEVGKCGVAISSLDDMERLFNGIPLDKVTTSMTINAPAAVVWAMYLATGESQGVKMDRLGGTIQNDILKEYQAQKEWIFPPEYHLRLIVDTVEFATRHVPRWNPISISGYHIREAGSSAVQELAFTLANGKTYVQLSKERGLDVDDFASRLSFFFNSHNNFFEEIAKYRAARRIWARTMKDEFGAKNPRSYWLRFHTQTAGCSLTAQQPENNIVRTAIQGLAGVLGGTQSLHTNSMDEAWALTSEEAVRIALRTQQIIAYESGVVDTADPLGGAYFVEWLTDAMEEECLRYFDRIDELGGVVKGIEAGFFQREIADSAYRYQKEIERKERIIVGVNDYVIDEEVKIPILKVREEVRRRQVQDLARTRKGRNKKKAEQALSALRKDCEKEDVNLMPAILEAVKQHVTLGEICDVMRDIFGEYRESVMF
jgi:methylmalonyl-CoA mutase N-terminal domain/subunit